MPILFNELSTSLLRAILEAGSQDDVKNLITQSLQQSNTRKMNPEELSLFIHKMIIHLEALNPMNKNERQWSNINMARIHFNHIRRNSEFITGKV